MGSVVGKDSAAGTDFVLDKDYCMDFADMDFADMGFAGMGSVGMGFVDRMDWTVAYRD